MKTEARALTFMDAVLPRGLARDVALVVGFSVLTAICARIVIPLWPVPITAQTLAVLLAGALLGSRLGALSQLTYIAQGAMGLPVFYGGKVGIVHLLGPTGGYLFGFVAAAFVVGWLVERGWDRRFWSTALAMILGSAAMYALALSWLARFVPAQALLGAGLYPFIPGDLIKIVVASLALPSAWSLLLRAKS